MRFYFAFGFILLIVFVIAVLVGVPFFFKELKTVDFSNLFNFKLPTSVPSYSAPQEQPSSTPAGTQTGKISISGVSYSDQTQQITLRASYFSGNAINITGWKIKSLQKGETVIGKGNSLPQFSSADSDIELGSGKSAEISTGRGPLPFNFRVNGCFGWLSNLYSISYSLNYCPQFSLSDLSDLDSSCQELVLRNNSCRSPSEDTLNKHSTACRLWAEKNMNYNACVLKHKNDADFFKSWQIYTGNYNQIIDPLHDKVELRDQAGVWVDGYEY